MLYDYVDVKQEKDINDTIEIFFEIDGFKFRMDVVKESNKTYRPRRIVHLTAEPCPLCRKNYYHCYPLEENKMTIFEELTEHKSIRMEWLFV